MFENDEWDIEEDYLKDFKSDELLEDFQNEKKETQTSSSKSEVKSTQKSSTNSSGIVFNVTASQDSKKHTDSQDTDTDSRKNVILNIFKSNAPVQTNSNSNLTQMVSTQQNLVDNIEKKILDKGNLNENRKNLILDVFKKNMIISDKSKVVSSKPIVKSVLKISERVEENENKLKRKKHVAFSESVNEPNVTKKLCISSTTDQSCKKVNQSLNIDCNDIVLSTPSEENKNKVSDSRKQMLIELLKSPVKNARTSRIKQTVIRKFPGPAGLLPDDVDDSEVVDLEALDENKNNKTNKYADICSQNTKNLFTTGAWQLMIDDLPSNFELYDIATVKENALQYSRTYKKVPYLAGVIQHIDYKPNDPHVVLKDLSGKIDARIHHSICKLYPNSLGNNIVLLVKDVGLIVTSKKYVCIIISLKNLVSIYSDEARLVETAHLEQLLDNTSNCNLNQSQISILDEIENQEENEKSNVKYSKKQIQTAGPVLKDNSNIYNDSLLVDTQEKVAQSVVLNHIHKISSEEKNSKISNQIDEIDDFEFNEDDAWLSVNVNDLNSFKACQFPSSTPLNINESATKESEVPEKNITCLKNYEWQKKIKPVMKKSNISSNLYSNKTLPIVPDKDLNNSLILKTNDSSTSNQIVSNKSVHSETTNENSKQVTKLNESITSKLAAFRSKHVLTPPPNLEEQNEEENSSLMQNNTNSLIAPFTSKDKVECENESKLLSNNLFDCDTDDEMLSQLDVDAIAATYSGQ